MGCFMGPGVKDIPEEDSEEAEPAEVTPTATTSTKKLEFEFNDTIIKLSKMSQMSSLSLHSPFSQRTDKNGRRPTLVFNNELTQVVNFKIGNEVLCMSWNMQHTTEGTPFDYYCDFRSLNLSERDSVTIEILWDVARVFLFSESPTELCGTTILSSLVHPALLSDEVLDRFCSSAKLSDREESWVKKLPEASLLELLNAHMYDEDINQALHNDCSFSRIHLRNSGRATTPFLQSYKPEAYWDLLKRDPSLLPVLILDSLHVTIIKFSQYLIDNHLRKAFSEFESEAQVEWLAQFCGQHDKNDLTLPATFVQVKARLYDKWGLAFLNKNKVQQVWRKADQTKADIILLQRLTKGVFKEMVSKFSGKYAIVPSKFPSGAKETTTIMLCKETVKLEKDRKTRRVNDHIFAVLCNTCDIRYYVGVVNLTEGDNCGGIRKKEVSELKRVIGKNTPVIIGGDFNEDLTAFDNPVAQIMLKTYNGIDHTQDESLALINRTRTNLQFEVAKSDKIDKGVPNGIFSSFPLVGEAFTDFMYSGHDNPSDHGPVFQRVMLGLF